MTDPELLERIADAIVAGRSFDWENDTVDSSPELRDLLDQLHVVAGIADLHRTMAASLAASTPVSEVDSAQTESGAPPGAWMWGPLRVEEHVAGGAGGDVYRAWDTRLNREVALKFPRDVTPERDSSALEEGRRLARVRHPNVVTVHGAERFDGRVGTWMEFIRGRTLEEELEAWGPHPPRDAAAIVMIVCRAVQAVHDAGLLHGDVKAQNVMREPSGRVVLMDFHAGTEACGDALLLQGTPAYLAPEILFGRGPASFKSDVYAIGVLAYRLLTNGFPHSEQTLGRVIASRSLGALVPLRQRRSGVPTRLARIIERALNEDPGRRPGADEMADALERWLATTAPGRPRHRVRRLLLMSGATAAVVTAVLVVGGTLGDVRGTGVSRASLGWFWPSSAHNETPSLPSLTEVHWRDFAASGPPSGNGKVIGGFVWLEPAVRDLVTGDVTVVQRRQHEDDSAGRVVVSPDGTLVAFTWFVSDAGDERSEIRVAPTTGGPASVLWPGDQATRARVVGWMSQQHELLVLLTPEDASGRDTPADCRLVAVDVATGLMRQLTRLEAVPDGVALSPDGTRVAFDHAAGEGDRSRRVSVVDLQSGRHAELPSDDGNDVQPCWMPNGTTVTFSSDRDGTIGLWAVDVSGNLEPSTPRLLKGGMGRYRPLGFTTAGDFYFSADTTDFNVYRVTLDRQGRIASAPAPVTQAFAGRNLEASWSPDGSQIAMVSRRGDGATRRGGMQIVVLSASGQEVLRASPDLDAVRSPQWAPDGQSLVFDGRLDGSARPYTLSIGTGAIQPAGPPGLAVPRWSADGSRLLGAGLRNGRWGIVSWSPADHRERELARPTNMAFAVSPDERWLATTRESPTGVTVAIRAMRGDTWRDVFAGERGDRLVATEWLATSHELLVVRSVKVDQGGRPSTQLWAIRLDGDTAVGKRLVGVIDGLKAVRGVGVRPGGQEILLTAGGPASSVWVLKGLDRGPVLRDRTWFFAGVEHTTRDYAPAGHGGPEWRDAGGLGRWADVKRVPAGEHEYRSRVRQPRRRQATPDDA